MRKKLFLNLSLTSLVLFTLASCNNQTSNNNIDSSEALKASATYGEFNGGEAPDDYKNISLSNLNDMKDIYFLVNHKMANSNYYSYSYGTAIASGLYKQDIVANVVNKGKLSFSQTYTKGEFLNGGGAISSILKLSLSNASMSFEDASINRYLYRGLENNGTVDVDLEKKTGSASGFTEVESSSTRNGFKSIVGHDLFNITNYEVINLNSIINVTPISGDEVSGYVYEFSFTTSGDSSTDASYYYKKQQKLMLGNLSQMVDINIKELKTTLYFNSDWTLTKTETSETYDVTLANTSISSVKTSLTNEYYLFDEEIPDSQLQASYTKASSEMLA